MFEALLERGLSRIEAVKRHVLSSNQIRTLIANRQLACKDQAAPCFNISLLQNEIPDVTNWRIIDHCSAVTRLYAIYEKFVHDLLTEFLAFLETNVAYANLDQSIRDRHRESFGQVLVRFDREQYKSLQLSTILADFSGAFDKSGRYRLLPEAMLSHDQNLRFSELEGLFNRCGIVKSGEWIHKHRYVREFFSSQARQSDKADAELKQLVHYRNEAAHGGMDVDAVLGPEILVEYAEFLEALLVALAECVQWAVLERSIEQDHVRRSGTVDRLLHRNIVIALMENCKLSVGDIVYVRGRSFCYPVKILSIQENNVDIEEKVVVNSVSLGIRFDLEVPRTSEIFCFQPPSTPVEPLEADEVTASTTSDEFAGSNMERSSEGSASV